MVMTKRALKTVADYLSLDDDTRVELIEGEFFVTPSPNFRHQKLLLRLAERLDAFAGAAGVGEVVPAPFDVILSEHDVVQPDIVFISTSRLGQIRERLHGPPDLAVEILSPSNSERDLIVKRDLYRRHRLPEYWIVDGERRTVEVLRLLCDDWTLHGIFEAADELTSPSLPGLRIPLSEIFKE